MKNISDDKFTITTQKCIQIVCVITKQAMCILKTFIKIVNFEKAVRKTIKHLTV